MTTWQQNGLYLVVSVTISFVLWLMEVCYFSTAATASILGYAATQTGTLVTNERVRMWLLAVIGLILLVFLGSVVFRNTVPMVPDEVRNALEQRRERTVNQLDESIRPGAPGADVEMRVYADTREGELLAQLQHAIASLSTQARSLDELAKDFKDGRSLLSQEEDLVVQKAEAVVRWRKQFMRDQRVGVVDVLNEMSQRGVKSLSVTDWDQYPYLGWTLLLVGLFAAYASLKAASPETYWVVSFGSLLGFIFLLAFVYFMFVHGKDVFKRVTGNDFSLPQLAASGGAGTNATSSLCGWSGSASIVNPTDPYVLSGLKKGCRVQLFYIPSPSISEVGPIYFPSCEGRGAYHYPTGPAEAEMVSISGAGVRQRILRGDLQRNNLLLKELGTQALVFTGPHRITMDVWCQS